MTQEKGNGKNNTSTRRQIKNQQASAQVNMGKLHEQAMTRCAAEEFDLLRGIFKLLYSICTKLKLNL